MFYRFCFIDLREGLNKIIIYFFRNKSLFFTFGTKKWWNGGFCHEYHWKNSDWIFVKSNVEDRCNYNLDKCKQMLQSRYNRDFPNFQDGRRRHLGFWKKAIVGAWHHPDLISRGSEDSKTVLTSNTCFFKGVKSGFHLTIKFSSPEICGDVWLSSLC